MEFAITWSNFGVIPNLDQFYGFDIGIDDADASGSRNSQIVWKGDANNYNNLSKVALIQLTDETVGGSTQTIHLNKGWNLISFNVVPIDSSVSSVFNGIINSVGEIKNSNGFYNPKQINALNSLQWIEQGKSYWVKSKDSIDISLTGKISTLSSNSIITSCKSGWNMIGCPFQVETNISTAFSSNSFSIIKNVQGFYITGNSLNSLNTLKPGEGYFLKR